MKSSHDVLHKQPIFILICSITVLLTIASFSVICYQLELKLTLDDLNSYSNIDKVIYIPKLIASSGFAILAFYALWFRINQTSVQIKYQESQIKELRSNNKANQLIAEIDKISDRILEMSHKIEKPTDFTITKIMLERAKEIGTDAATCTNNHSSKITEMEFPNGQKNNLEWTGGTIQNLNVYLNVRKNENSKSSYIELYREYEKSYKSKHSTISSQLKMFIDVAIDLIELDSSHSSYVRNALSLHFEVASILEKVGLLEPQYIYYIHHLQSLARPKDVNKINFKKIYLQEMKGDGLIELDIGFNDLEYKFINGSFDCEIKIQGKTYHRANGVYKEITV